MKIIKKLIIPLVIMLILVIYITNKDNKIYYVSIGDEMGKTTKTYSYSEYVNEYLKKINKLEFYTKDFTNINKRTTDILNDIEDNIFITSNNSKITIKKALMKGDVITLSTGMNEIFYKINSQKKDHYIIYEYIDELMNDIDKLVDVIKRYCKEDIIVIGYYNPYNNDMIDNIIKYANNKLIDISIKENINYIDTYNLFKNQSNIFVDNIYPNKEGNDLIGKKIIEIINKKVLKTQKII